MRIAILGTGNVGQTLGTKLVESGHEVRLGSRTADNEKGLAWVGMMGETASLGVFSDAAAWGEVVINATAGVASVAAIESAGVENLAGKVLIDVSNPLDFSGGFPPTLAVCNTDSLGEQIQAAAPDARVVKTLNTVAAELMVAPQGVPGRHTLFICGNDAAAKSEVRGYLDEWFGWKNVMDLGDITSARGTEAILLLWTRMWGSVGTPLFNFEIRKGSPLSPDA